MQSLGFGIFAVILIGAAWMFSRSMTSNERNAGDRHGGGLDELRDGTEQSAGGSSDVT